MIIYETVKKTMKGEKNDWFQKTRSFMVCQQLNKGSHHLKSFNGLTYWLHVVFLGFDCGFHGSSNCQRAKPVEFCCCLKRIVI
ncbi:MAG: hypothetical protein A2252_02645 [Elusimicrobia bacterium RIFOXYA2_FULL_39_19]|nr:MAG: hypothetical protein A2252_02645 [Elusimicrobia bacterium RIFOXYA2_FULL_39_19]